MRNIVLFPMLVLLLGLSACGGDDGGSQGQDGSTRCSIGEKKACACTNGASGFKACGDDERWEACACDGTVTPPDASGGDTSGGLDVVGGDTSCVAACAGAQCGDDGCGGQCGTCPPGQSYSNGTCTGGGDPCQGISFEGCCQGTVLKYCEGDTVQSGDCSQSTPPATKCGWDATQGFYNCVETASADPSGQHPLACPAP